MAEVVFARNFLATLESRPVKLSADHVEDPKNFPARPPYILPKMPKAFSKPAAVATQLAPGQERSFTVHVKSLRNPPVDVKLSSQSLSTSMLDIKNSVSEKARIPVDKMKLLYKKKPVPDSKVLKELVTEEAQENVVEFSIMVIGGAAAVLPQQDKAGEEGEAAADGGEGMAPIGAAALETDAFWEDLKGFLMQRLKDEKEAEELSSAWRADWQSKR